MCDVAVGCYINASGKVITKLVDLCLSLDLGAKLMWQEHELFNQTELFNTC